MTTSDSHGAVDQDGLRYLQRDAVSSVGRHLGIAELLPDGEPLCHGPFARATLVQMPTGLGKTQTFGAIAKHCPGRVLVLAHRKELIYQARARLEKMTGEFCDVEMAKRSSYCSRIVVGSMQSISQKRRLTRLGRRAFDLIIVDECHRSECRTYKKILDFFDAKVLGVTATPDRGDGIALAETFDTVAYSMDILDGIEAGYLCPVEAERVFVEEIDLTHIRKQKGDLELGKLEEEMVRNANAVVLRTLERVESGKQGVVFFPGVKSAMLAAEKFNEMEPGSAVFVCGETPDDERTYSMERFKAGDARWLVNVDIATEGFDHPPAEVCVMASPTLSRLKYAQRAGRVTRVVAPVDTIPGPDGADARRQLIANSSKPSCLILDFCGNTKHSLCSPEDILGERLSEEELSFAKEAGEQKPGRRKVADSLRAARERAKALAASRARVRAIHKKVDAFQRTGGMVEGRGRNVREATENQKLYLRRLGHPDPRDLTFVQASQEIERLKVSRPATHQQKYAIAQHAGRVPADLSFETASKCMEYIIAQREKGLPPKRAALEHLINKGRCSQ